MADSFFCLDLGESYFKIADVGQKGNLLEAYALGIQEMEPLFFRADTEAVVEKTAAVISKLLKQLHVSKKNVRIVLPDSFTYNQFVDMPQLHEKELLSAIKYQADQFIPMPMDEVNIDIETVFEDQRTKKLLALISAAPKKIVENVEKLAQYIGIYPESIETETSAVGRLANHIFKKTQSAQKEGSILVNFGFSSSTVYFFDLVLGTVTYSHNFPVGYNLFLKEIQVNLNVDQKKSIELLKTIGLAQNASYNTAQILRPTLKSFVDEVTRSVSEISTKNSIHVSSIYLFNEVVRFNAFAELLGKYFGATSSILSLFPFFERNPAVDAVKENLGFFVSTVGGMLR